MLAAIETQPTANPPRVVPSLDPVDWKAPPELIDVGHSRVGYRRVGDGPDLVFVHGWPLHGATFRGLLPHLVGSFTCHLIDLPGCGGSEWDERTPISFSDHAATVRRVIVELGLVRYAFVAHDSGGTIARLVAADDDCTVGLVLGNTEIPGHHAPLLRLLLGLARFPGGRSLLLAALRWRWLRRSLLIRSCFGDPSKGEGEFHRLFIEPLLSSPRVAAGQLKALDRFRWADVDGLAEVHRRIAAPVQLVWGADDAFFPLAAARPMAAQFGGGAELVEIPRGRTFVHEEAPDRFAALMRPFLDRCFA